MNFRILAVGLIVSIAYQASASEDQKIQLMIDKIDRYNAIDLKESLETLEILNGKFENYYPELVAAAGMPPEQQQDIRHFLARHPRPVIDRKKAFALYFKKETESIKDTIAKRANALEKINHLAEDLRLLKYEYKCAQNEINDLSYSNSASQTMIFEVQNRINGLITDIAKTSKSLDDTQKIAQQSSNYLNGKEDILRKRVKAKNRFNKEVTDLGNAIKTELRKKQKPAPKKKVARILFDPNDQENN